MRPLFRASSAVGGAALVLGLWAGGAPAFEPGAHVPYMAGVAGGVPIGVLPPPSFYVSSLTGYSQGTAHADIEPRRPPGLAVFTEGLTLLWVPDLKILGATYGVYAVQTLAVKTLSHIPPHDRASTETGLVNTVISPLNLAWKLPSDFYVSGRFNVQLQDGQYSRSNTLNIANNFWTFEPNVGVSYLKGGLDLSLHLVYDISTENTNTRALGSVDHKYQSGNVFTGEYSATYAIGNWRWGLTGYGVAQTNDDSAGGRTLKHTSLTRTGLGPIAEFNNKWVGINLYYTRDVAWSRAFGGDNFFFKVTVKF